MKIRISCIRLFEASLKNAGEYIEFIKYRHHMKIINYTNKITHYNFPKYFKNTERHPYRHPY